MAGDGRTATHTTRRRRFTDGDKSDIRRIDPASGAVLERLEKPPGTGVSGMDSDGADLFYCGGGPSGKVRAVRRQHRSRRAPPSNR
jgi:hypothetical protein